MCTCLPKLSKTQLGWHVGLLLTAQNFAARLALEEHQNCPVLNTNETRFTLSMWLTLKSLEMLWGMLHSACDIIQHDPVGGGAMMVWGEKYHTDLCMLDNGALTVVRYKHLK